MEKPTPEKMAFLSAGYMLASMQMPRGLVPVARAGRVTVYRNPSAYPMARFVSDQMVAGEWQLDTRGARIVVNAPESGTVLLAQQLAPGWRVKVDGEPRPPLLLGDIFRGVEVAKGRHEIVWSYRPWSLVAGALVTLVTVLAMGISIVVKRRR
jgi:hypothetical protein